MSERGSKLNRIADRFIGIPLTLPAAVFRKFEKRRVLQNEINSVAIICLGAIGDLLFTSTIINALKNLPRPPAIDMYTTKGNAQAAALLQGVHKTHSFRLSQIFQMIRTIRQNRYDLLIDTTQWARVGSLVSAFSGAKLTVGFKTAGQWRSLPYDIKVSHNNQVHEWQNFLSLVKAVFPEASGVPAIHPGCGLKCPVAVTSPFAVFHMWPAGSHVNLKLWDEPKWAELSEHLTGKGLTVVYSGSAADRERTEQFINRYLPLHPKVMNLAGELKVDEMAALLQNAAVAVSVNTGIMHLAALVKTPTVCIHGPTNPLRWGPVGEKTAALLPENAKPFLNLGFEKPMSLPAANAKDVTVKQVTEAIGRLLCL